MVLAVTIVRVVGSLGSWPQVMDRRRRHRIVGRRRIGHGGVRALINLNVAAQRCWHQVRMQLLGKLAQFGFRNSPNRGT